VAKWAGLKASFLLRKENWAFKRKLNIPRNPVA